MLRVLSCVVLSRLTMWPPICKTAFFYSYWYPLLIHTQHLFSKTEKQTWFEKLDIYVQEVFLASSSKVKPQSAVGTLGFSTYSAHLYVTSDTLAFLHFVACLSVYDTGSTRCEISSRTRN